MQHLNRLYVHHVRNIGTCDINLSHVNIFTGKNGSGKTSVLESCFLLSRGKSFRHHEPKRYITHGAKNCTVFASTPLESFAIEKNQNAQTILKHNGTSVKSQYILTKKIPLLVLDPKAVTLLEEGSGERRQLLDWLCFYAHNHFHQTWLTHERLLRQRASLLKSIHANDAHKNQLRAWDVSLAKSGEALHQMRKQSFLRWQTYFYDIFSQLLPQYKDDVCLNYYAGFDENIPLADILAKRADADILCGYTRIGAHRADILVHIKKNKQNIPAIHLFSRGEKKLLICALVLSKLLSQKFDVMPMVLLDDFDAELDNAHKHMLMQTLLSLPCQLFMTTLNMDYFDNHPPPNSAFFSIHNGRVQPL